VSAFRALQRRSESGRIEQQIDESLLILDRKADEVSFFDRPFCGLSGGGHDEVAEGSTLNFGGTPDDRELRRGDAGFDSRGSRGF
jgi:hypothetical protein